MGAAGVEGVFRRCCEKVMGLMRNSQEAILTIVEVGNSLSCFPMSVGFLLLIKHFCIPRSGTNDPFAMLIMFPT